MLNPRFLKLALNYFNFLPCIDLFASRINKQFNTYVSYKPDPYAKHIDAFTITWSTEDFYCFPPFSCVTKVIRKIYLRQSARHTGGARLADSNLVSDAAPNSRATSSPPPTISRPTNNAVPTQPQTPTTCEDEPSYLSCIRKQLQIRGFTPSVINIILSSWRKGTQFQYQSAAKKWFEFCIAKNCDMVSPPLPSALSYLTALHESGLSYSSVNTARSVLSSILAWEDCQTPFGQLPIVKRFMKGIF